MDQITWFKEDKKEQISLTLLSCTVNLPHSVAKFSRKNYRIPE